MSVSRITKVLPQFTLFFAVLQRLSEAVRQRAPPAATHDLAQRVRGAQEVQVRRVRQGLQVQAPPQSEKPFLTMDTQNHSKFPVIFLIYYFFSCFKYWNFWNKFFLKIKSLKKKYFLLTNYFVTRLCFSFFFIKLLLTDRIWIWLSHFRNSSFLPGTKKEEL